MLAGRRIPGIFELQSVHVVHWHWLSCDTMVFLIPHGQLMSTDNDTTHGCIICTCTCFHDNNNNDIHMVLIISDIIILLFYIKYMFMHVGILYILHGFFDSEVNLCI